MKSATLGDLTKDEKSLLLFFECAAVDYGGRLKIAHMNKADVGIVDGWIESGFIEFGRIKSAHANRDGAHWVKLSPEAMTLAQEERRARAERMWEKRCWRKTTEK